MYAGRLEVRAGEGLLMKKKLFELLKQLGLDIAKGWIESKVKK